MDTMERGRELAPLEKPLMVGHGGLTFERPAILSKISFQGGHSTVGAFSYGNAATIIYDCDIGRYCSIARNVMVGPYEHPTDWLSTSGFAFNDPIFGHDLVYQSIRSPERFSKSYERTSIGNDVWIGHGAFIRRGATIGDGAIVGAGSVVIEDVPPYAIVGGNPARLIRYRFDAATIEKLQHLRWWNYLLDRSILGDLKYSNVTSSIAAIALAIENDRLTELQPAKIHITSEMLHPR